MPTLEDILNLKKNNSSLDLVPMSNVNPITQEELDAMHDGINNLIENRGFNPTGLTKTDFIKNHTTGINADAVTNDYLSQALKSPGMGSYTNSLLNATMKADNKLPSEEESVIKEDQSDFFARYDFPMYADNDDPVLAEQAGFAKQTNMDAIVKGAKNIVPVAIGVGAQMLGGTMQIANNLLGDDDYDNPITAWGRDYMEKHMSPIYQAEKGQTFSSPKSLIAAGSEILGQFGSAIGSMVGMQPINSAIVRTSVGIGSALGGPVGAMVGTIAGTIAAAAMNAYAEGVIDAADVHDEKYAELIKKTGNERYSRDTAKLAASTVAGQDMMLNTALNIIPVMWSTKPQGVDRYIKNALGLDDIDEKWFNLHKPYVPQKLVSETLNEYEERLAKIVGSNYANNMQYSMTARPLEALKNIGGYLGQKKGALAYNFKHPIELLRRNWDIVGETLGEGLEEYHNYYAREQGMKVYSEEDAGWLPSIPTLMKGYSDMVTKGEGAYDLVAGAIIGGLTSPILSNVRYGRTKVFNPHTGQMEYKYDRNKLVDWVPFEFNKEFDKHDYNQYVINSLNTIRDSKELANSYVTTQNADDRHKILNQLLSAPLTNYIDNNAYDAYMLSMEAFSNRLSQLDFNQDENLAKGYLTPTDKTLYEGLLTQRDTLLSQTDPNSVTRLNSTNDSIKLLKDKAKQAAGKHDQMLKSRIHFLKETAEDYKKVKEEVESTYGNADYGYANALFKNKMALELEKGISANAEQNYNSALTNLKNKIKADNPTDNEVELMNKFEQAVESGTSSYQDLVNAWVAAKKDKYASDFRLHRFTHRYNSLNSWGYENNDDLVKELELLEQLSDFKFTDDEIKTLGEKDTIMKNISYYNTLRQQFQASLALETDSVKKQELQQTIDYLDQYINADPNANAAYAKYLDFVSLTNELNAMYKKQVSNQQNFKGNEKAFKDFNPFRKYLQRNEILAKELKKMSQAKTNIDLIKTDILGPYEEYAAIYEDSLLDNEKINVFDKMLESYDKLMYNNALKKFDSDDYKMYEKWLGVHDLKFNEVLAKMKLAVTKYSTPGTENKTLVKYAKKMIEMMNYQKDVVDQLKIIKTQQTIQIINSNVEETIDLLNKGVIDIDTAITNIQANPLINNDEKTAFIEALNNLKVKTDINVDFEHSYTQQLDYYHNATDGSIAVNHALKTTFSVRGTTISKNTEVLYRVIYGPNNGTIINDVSTYTKLAPNMDISTIGDVYDMNFLLEMSDYIEFNNPAKILIDNNKVIGGLVNYLTIKYPINVGINDIKIEIEGFISLLSKLSTDTSLLDTLHDNIYSNNILDLIYMYLNKSFYSDVIVDDVKINTMDLNTIISIINDSLTNNSSINIQTTYTKLSTYVRVQTAFKDYSKLIGNVIYYFSDIDSLSAAGKNKLKTILNDNDNETDIHEAIRALNFSVTLNKVDPDNVQVTNMVYVYNITNKSLNRQTDINTPITNKVFKDFIVTYDIDNYNKVNKVNYTEITNIITTFSTNLKLELDLDDSALKELTIADINNNKVHNSKKSKLRLQFLAVKLLDNGYYNPLLFFEFQKLYAGASNTIKNTTEFKQSLHNIEKKYLIDSVGINTYVHTNGLRYKLDNKPTTDYTLLAAGRSIIAKPSTIDISFIDANVHTYNDKYVVKKENGIYNIYELDNNNNESLITGFSSEEKERIINYLALTHTKLETKSYVSVPTNPAAPVTNQSTTIDDGISLPKPIIQHHDNIPLLEINGIVTYGTVKIKNSQNNNATLYIDTNSGSYGVGMSNNDADDDQRIIKPYEMSTLVLKHLLSKQKPYTKFDEILKLIAEGRTNSEIMILLSLPNSTDIIESIRNTGKTTKILGGYSFARGVIAKKIGINTYTLRKVGNSGFIVLNSDGSIDREIINVGSHSNSIIAEVDNNTVSFNGAINDVDNNNGLDFNVTLNRDQKLVLIDGNFKTEVDKNIFIQNLNNNDLSNHDNYGFIIINYDESELSIGEKFINSIERKNEQLEKELYNIVANDTNNTYIVKNGYHDIDSTHNDRSDALAKVASLNIDNKKTISKNKLILTIEKTRLIDKDDDIHNNKYIEYIEKGELEKSDVLFTLRELGLLTTALETQIENIGKPLNEQEPIDTTENDNPMKDYTNKLSEYISNNKLPYTIIGTKLFPIVVKNYDPNTNNGNDVYNQSRTFRKLESNELLNFRTDLNFYIELTELNNDILYTIFTKVYMAENLNQIGLHVNPIIAKLLITNLDENKRLEFATTYLTEIKNIDGNFIAYVKTKDKTFRAYSTQDTNYSTKLSRDAKTNDFKYKINNNATETINVQSIASGKIRIYKGFIHPFNVSETGFSGKKVNGKVKYNSTAVVYVDKNGTSKKVIQYTIVDGTDVIIINATKSNNIVTLDELDVETGMYMNAGTLYAISTKADGTKIRNVPIKIKAISPYYTLFLKDNNVFIKDFVEFIGNDTKFNMIDFLALIYINNPKAITKSDLDNKAYDDLLKVLDAYSTPNLNYKLNNFKVNLLNAYIDFLSYNIKTLNKTVTLFDKFVYDHNTKSFSIGTKIVTDYVNFTTELEKYVNAATTNMDINQVFDWYKQYATISINEFNPNTIEDEVDTSDDVINDSKSNDDVENNKEAEKIGLVLNTPNAVANSHREKSQLATNYFSTYDSVFGTVTVQQGEFDRRRDGLRKLLNGEIALPNQPISVFISLETTDNISITKNNSPITLQTKEHYKTQLSDLFDVKYGKDKLKFLYNMGILELMYMSDVTMDNNDTLTINNSDRYKKLLPYTTNTDRYKYLIDYFSNNPINVKIAKQIYIISKTQFIVDTLNNNDHIGYIHDLEYLTNELRSVSLLGNNIFGLSNIELLDYEVDLITIGFKFLNKIYNDHTDNMRKSYVMNLNNYGKLNTVKKPMVSSLLSFKKIDKVKFFQLSSVRQVNNNHNFVLKNFTNIGKDLNTLYDGENMDIVTYLYNIVAPSIGKDWINILKSYIEIVTNRNDLFSDSNIVKTIIDIYENNLSDAQKSSIENTIITTRWKSINADEKTVDFKSVMSIYMVSIKNPFQIDGNITKTIDGKVVTKKSISNRFFNLGNTTLERLLENYNDNFDNIHSNDSTEKDNIDTYLKKAISYITAFKTMLFNETKEILKNVSNTDLSTNFIYNVPQPASNIIEKSLLLRKMFKLVSIKYPSGDITSTKSIATKLAESKMYTLGSLYLKYKDNTTGTIFVALKTGNKVEVLNVNDKKLYVYTIDSNSNIELSNDDGKAKILNDIEFDTKLDEMIPKIYLNISYTDNAQLNTILQTNVLGINDYFDLVRLITNTNINGISNHFFINPILSITDDDKSTVESIKVNDISNPNEPVNNQTFEQYFRQKFKKWTGAQKFNNLHIDKTKIESAIKDYEEQSFDNNDIYELLIHDLDDYELNIC